MILLLVSQIAVLNNVHLLGYGTPILLVYLTMKFHRNSSRMALLLWGFSIGLVHDMFSNTMGIGMASCTFLAMIQPALLNLFTPHDQDDDFVPSMRSMGVARYLFYTYFTFLIFHIVFYALDAFTLAHLQQALIGLLFGHSLAFVIILFVELIKNPVKGGGKDWI